MRRKSENNSAASSPSRPSDSGPEAAGRWQPQLVQRRYLELVEPALAGHYAVRLSAPGASCYFPLGESDENRAAAKAIELHQLLQRQGWETLCRQQPREFTLALYWNDNPLLSTYTTLLSRCDDRAEISAPASSNPPSRLRVGIIEADPSIRLALIAWANRLPGCFCADAIAPPDHATFQRLRQESHLVLFNRSQADWPAKIAGDDALPRPLIPFGTYETSDDIFISHTGVSFGYFLRRTHPEQMLEPVRGAWNEGAPSPDGFWMHIRSYFQALVEPHASTVRSSPKTALTPREEEILLRLSKGYPDKQIASTLNISSWTVHNHMKNIFRKLGVHTRTQAVLKYLQR
jgi:DNA-binding CsgD family transcriptional regulator